MKIIYDKDEKKPGPIDTIFQNYPLHRGVYDRVHILTGKIRPLLEKMIGEKKG